MAEITVLNLKPDKVQPSPFNNRVVRLADPDFKGLVASVKANGVVEPVLVRACPGKKGVMEIVFGERRRVAAIQAKKLLPAMVQELDDKQAKVMIVVENFHRTDLSILEEAANVGLLLKNGPDVTLKDVASLVGKSETWIRVRANLQSLTKEWKDHLAGKGTEENEDGWGSINIDEWGVTRLEEVALCPPEVQQRLHKFYTTVALRRPSLSELRSKIADEVTQLKQATFDPEDGKLLRNVGACTDCPKRKGASPDLFGIDSQVPIRKDECLDAKCFATKEEAIGRQKLAAVKKRHPDAKVVVFDLYGVHAKDGWLAKFTDAEGNIYLEAKSAKEKGAVRGVVKSKGAMGNLVHMVLNQKATEQAAASAGKEVKESKPKTVGEARAALVEKRKAYIGTAVVALLEAMDWTAVWSGLGKKAADRPANLCRFLILTGGAGSWNMEGDSYKAVAESDQAVYEYVWRMTLNLLDEDYRTISADTLMKLLECVGIDEVSGKTKVLEFINGEFHLEEPAEWEGLKDADAIPAPKEEKKAPAKNAAEETYGPKAAKKAAPKAKAKKKAAADKLASKPK